MAKRIPGLFLCHRLHSHGGHYRRAGLCRQGNHVGLPGAGRDRKNCPHRHRPAGRLVDYLSHAGGRASRCCGSPGSKRGGFAQIADDAPSTARTSAAQANIPTLSISVAASPGASGEAGRWDRHRHPGGGQPGGGGHRDHLQCDRRAEGQNPQTVKSWWAAITTSISGASRTTTAPWAWCCPWPRPWWTADISRKTT